MTTIYKCSICDEKFDTKYEWNIHFAGACQAYYWTLPWRALHAGVPLNYSKPSPDPLRTNKHDGA